jgi:hypothetical protein
MGMNIKWFKKPETGISMKRNGTCLSKTGGIRS